MMAVDVIELGLEEGETEHAGLSDVRYCCTTGSLVVAIAPTMKGPSALRFEPSFRAARVSCGSVVETRKPGRDTDSGSHVTGLDDAREDRSGGRE